MTLLRLVLNDEGKANDDAVKAIKGVKSVIKQGGQYQVVIGNEVSNLFKEFKKLGNFSDEGGAAPQKAEGNIVQRLFGFIYVEKYDDGSGDLSRRKKKSFDWYKKVIASNGDDLA